MNYPTLDDVNSAPRLTICRWYRHLPSPKTQDQIMIINRLSERYKEFRGTTPSISKVIGWKSIFRNYR